MTDDEPDADEVYTGDGQRGKTNDGPVEEVDWTSVPTDPDPNGELGYELAQWERIPVADDPDQVIFLPEKEEDIAEDAFIVTEEGSLCDLVTRR